MNMSINIIKEEIDILIDTIREQHNIVKEYKGRIPQIELDIVMSNVRDLYEYLNELNKINNLRRTQQPIEVSTEILDKIAHTKKEKTLEEVKEVVQEPIIDKEVFATETIEALLVEVLTPELVSIVEDPQISVEKEEEVAGVITPEEVIIAPTEEEIKPKTDDVVLIEEVEEIVIEAEEQKEPDSKKEAKEPKKPSKSEKPAIMDMFADSEKTSLSDKFKDEKKSLNEKLGEEKKEKSLADKIQKKPIKDLKTAIGINDKFIFINELFKGSLQEYNKAIETINAYNSDSEAFLFIEELKGKYNWEEKADVYVKLEEFVLRKFL
jgi:hypothetical protein